MAKGRKGSGRKANKKQRVNIAKYLVLKDAGLLGSNANKVADSVLSRKG